MADFFGAATDILGGIGGFLGGQAESGAASKAAQTYAQAANLSMASTKLKTSMIGRQIYQALGGIRAATSGNGLSTAGGNAQDLIRDSAQQGAISKAVVGLQGQIDYNSYMAQSQAEAAKASSSSSSGFMSLAGAAIGAVAMFSDDALKQDVELIRRRGDGIGIFKFRYIGSEEFFEGAMASDVETVRPDAIYYYNDLGIRMVDYEAINMELRRAA